MAMFGTLQAHHEFVKDRGWKRPVPETCMDSQISLACGVETLLEVSKFPDGMPMTSSRNKQQSSVRFQGSSRPE